MLLIDLSYSFSDALLTLLPKKNADLYLWLRKGLSASAHKREKKRNN